MKRMGHWARGGALRTGALVLGVACFVSSASCTAILGISDPIDEGASDVDGAIDEGALDSGAPDVHVDTGAVDSIATDSPFDTTDAMDTSVDTVPEAGVDCGTSADGTVCAATPRSICLKGTCSASRCGDGFADKPAGEECDDGNATNGDGCDVDCTYSCASIAKPAKTCGGGTFCVPKTCSVHTCVVGASPCKAPSSCQTVTCDDATSSCPVALIDKDGDGHGPASSPVAAPCDDCDDTDVNTFPGQTLWFTTPRLAGGFDYDCDGVEEKERPTIGECAPSGGVCTFTPGWASGAVAGCGATDYYLTTCTPVSTACSYTTPKKTQGCH
jgi:cysteine-rich repeat protein